QRGGRHRDVFSKSQPAAEPGVVPPTPLGVYFTRSLPPERVFVGPELPQPLPRGHRFAPLAGLDRRFGRAGFPQ
ncbi:MAG: hypothetical protein ACKV0T_29895, partial [Planctomycetales bacterium]